MTSPAQKQLRYLHRLGFAYSPVLDETGELEFAYYTRDREGLLEAIKVYRNWNAHAYCLRPAANSDDKPFHVSPDQIARLIPMNDLVRVVHALLSGPPGESLTGGRSG